MKVNQNSLSADKMRVLFVGSNSTVGNGMLDRVALLLKVGVDHLAVFLDPILLLDVQVAVVAMTITS